MVTIALLMFEKLAFKMYEHNMRVPSLNFFSFFHLTLKVRIFIGDTLLCCVHVEEEDIGTCTGRRRVSRYVSLSSSTSIIKYVTSV